MNLEQCHSSGENKQYRTPNMKIFPLIPHQRIISECCTGAVHIVHINPPSRSAIFSGASNKFATFFFRQAINLTQFMHIVGHVFILKRHSMIPSVTFLRHP